MTELKKNEGDPKKFWRTFDKVINKQNKNSIEQIKSPVDGELLNAKDSSEALNAFYTTIADQLVSLLPDIQNEPLIENVNSVLKLDLCITPSKIKQILKDFTPLKSSGCLSISSRLYIDAFEVLAEPLAFIMNLSLRTEVFPSMWKCSIVTPIPKKGIDVFWKILGQYP